MTYTYKLARRLAISRNLAMLAVLALLVACAGDSTAPETSAPAAKSKPVLLRVVPRVVTVETKQLIRFRSEGHDWSGDSLTSPVVWEATGGVIEADGTFSSDQVGVFKVVGRGRGWKRTDTSTVVVVPPQPSLTEITISPSSATIAPGATRAFAATGRLRDRTSGPVGVVWSTTGGTVDPSGVYTAPSTAGAYQVIARNTKGTIADTALITIDRMPEPVSPLARLVISPAEVSVAAGASQHFLAYGRDAAGDSVAVPVDFSATGGTVTSLGLYTAARAIGTFRVVAKDTVTGLADTATIRVQRSPKTLTRVIVTPASVTLSTGGTQQFRTFGRTGDGDSVEVAAAFSSTGGTVTPGGLYTAGTTAGTYQVVVTTKGLSDTASVTLTRAPRSPVAVGIPFGPFNMLAEPTSKQSATSLSLTANPFTLSMDPYSADNIIPRIRAARAKGQRLMIAMASGAHSRYKTNGVFDMAKWKARMDTYRNPAIQAEVAAAVADGTILGNEVMDEPHNRWGANSWGPKGTMTKARVDQLCAYVKGIFPTLPVGVTHDWSTFEPEKDYAVCDFIVSQYRWWKTKGDVVKYRDSGLALARRNGIAIAFSLNIIDGGETVSGCPQPRTGGPAPLEANSCRMTAEQVRDWGKVLGTAGCALLMWRYDTDFFSRPDNLRAFHDVAATLSKAPARPCKRS